MVTFASLWILLSLAQSLGQSCREGDVRLRGGTEFAGHVEVCANGTWGTICDRLWDHNDAKVVCNQLNLSYSDMLKEVSASCGSACFGEGSGDVHYRDVNCTKETLFFSNCSHKTVGSGNCSSHSNDAGVICAINVSSQYMNASSQCIEVNETVGPKDALIVGGTLGTLSGILALGLSCAVVAIFIKASQSVPSSCSKDDHDKQTTTECSLSVEPNAAYGASNNSKKVHYDRIQV